MTTAFIFPGQGSQAVGMGKALAASFEVAKQVFEEADEALGESLSGLCFEGPLDALTLTANTQPAILTCSVAALAVLRAETDLTPTVCLGHSLGEYSALVAAGALSLPDAVRIVRRRGEAMQAAVAEGLGGMAAVIGLDPDVVQAVCDEAAQGEVCSPANDNGGGQIVIAGHAAAVARAVALVKSRKGRAIPLKVSAPFHCALMEPAATALAEVLEPIEVGPLSVPVVSNVEATPNRDPSRVKTLLVQQVTQRVRWEASVQHVVQAMGVRSAIEVGHGKVLAGLLRRIDREIGVRGVGSPEDISVLKGPR
ncbi:MAG: ACP S-malonyltransferase, partial [Nannocystaceae bacterium]|nr:ACP S-malonyltransferase [Nannocystaceae bacterium]